MPESTAPKHKKSLRWLAKLFIAFLTLFVLIDALIIVMITSDYYFNWTDSMPVGFYKTAPPDHLKKGDIVVVCLPQKIGLEGLKKGYLTPGKCAGGYDPIIKALIALPGDNVTLSNTQMTVDEQAYIAPVQPLDHSGIPLAAIARGNYQNTTDYWLYGAGNKAKSWDSRYWGGVSKTNIIYLAQPVLTFK